MSYDIMRDRDIRAAKLSSAEHDARFEGQYCDLTGNEGSKLHFKVLTGSLRVVSVSAGVERIAYFGQDEAERLRDFLNEWWPSSSETEEIING